MNLTDEYEAIGEGDDPYRGFTRFMETRLAYLNEKADQYTTVKDEYVKHYQFIQDLTADYSDWEMSTIKEIIEYGRDRSLFVVTDSETVSRAIFFALKGLEYP